MGKRLFIGSSRTDSVTAYDTETGEEQWRFYTGGPVRCAPVAADGRVYITGRDGTTVVLRHGETFEVLATNTLDDYFSASMALVGDEIYMRGDRYLYCIAED